MKYLSVCDGIGAAHEAWKELGWTCVGASEIERFPIEVVKHRHPEVPHLGDMTKYHEWNIERPDLVCGGTPCQAFSVAGLRTGLADPRGNLALVFLGIVDHFRPRWVVWENVPGVYSSTSHDSPDPKRPLFPVDLGCEGHEVDEADTYDAAETHAFACFVAGLQELGYGCFWRTLDAQYVGVAQRRRRCFLVGYFGDWRPAAAVLLEPESMSGDPAPRRQQGQGTAGTIAARTSGGGGLGTDFDLGGGIDDASATLSASHPSRRNGGSDPTAGHFVACPTADTLSVGANQTTGFVGDVIAHAVGADRVAPTLDAHYGDKQGITHQDANNGHGLLIPMQTHAFKFRGGGNSTGERGGNTGATGGVGYLGQDECAFTVSTEQDQHIAVPYDLAQVTSNVNRQNRENGDPSHTLAKDYASQAAVLTKYAVRRLTPRECERLMGFPDDYTRIPWRGAPEEECPDGPRYKACGNSWVVKEAKKLGRKIHLVEGILTRGTAAQQP